MSWAKRVHFQKMVKSLPKKRNRAINCVTSNFLDALKFTRAACKVKPTLVKGKSLSHDELFGIQLRSSEPTAKENASNLRLALVILSNQ